MAANFQLPNIASLWRYPLKSMMGEEMNATLISDSGVLGDRAYALVDSETDKVVSAKNPKKWPDIFAFRAAYMSEPQIDGEIPDVCITLPNGDKLRSSDDGIDEAISLAVHRGVTLQRRAPKSAALEQYWPEREGNTEEVTHEAMAGAAPEGTFFDYATIHIITTGTINKLRMIYPEGRFEVRRFRPNLVIETPSGEPDFIENSWVGKVLQIGEVTLQVTDPCPRCVMPTLAQGDLPKDPGIQRAMMANTVHVGFADRPLPSVGVYARVIKGGKIHRKDLVEVS
jgi:uncharacterized protein YcbX